MKPALKSFVLSVLAVAVLAACGGGGGSDPATQDTTPPASLTPTTKTLAGTAAGGAPVVGIVTVKDATGKMKSTQIEADGSYSVDVSDMTAPFMLRASGTVGANSVNYYSAASSEDQGKTINVTPFTTLIISNIAAKLAETYYNDGAFGTITPQALDAAETNLQEKLKPVLEALGLSAAIDLLRESFKADHSGLDAALDLIKVEIDSSTSVATLTNVLTKAKIGEDNLASQSDDATAVTLSDEDKSNLSTAGTELQKIQKVMADLVALFATGTPDEAKIAASGLFDQANFMENGQNFEQFASDLASSGEELVGMQIASSDIVITGPQTAQAKARLKLKDGNVETLDMLMARVDTNSAWKLLGNGRVGETEISSMTNTYSANYGSTSSYDAGLSLFADVEAYNVNHQSAPITRAVVTGPGVQPAGGIVLETTVESGYMSIVRSGPASGGYYGNFAPECSQAVTADCINFTQVTDNAKYTIKLYAGDTTEVGNYELVLPYKPVSRTEVGAENFASISSLTVDSVALTDPAQLQNGKSVTMTWAKPASLSVVDELRFNYLIGSGGSVQLEADLAPDTTSKSFMVEQAEPSGARGARFELSGKDQFGRTFLTIHEVRPVIN